MVIDRRVVNLGRFPKKYVLSSSNTIVMLLEYDAQASTNRCHFSPCMTYIQVPGREFDVQREFGLKATRPCRTGISPTTSGPEKGSCSFSK